MRFKKKKLLFWDNFYEFYGFLNDIRYLNDNPSKSYFLYWEYFKAKFNAVLRDRVKKL